MTPFAADAQGCCDNSESSVPAPGGGVLAFSPTLIHATVPAGGWSNWSNGYTGDVYYQYGITSITLTLPADTNAFYFYAQPNAFDTETMTATTDSGATSGPVNVSTPSGASYFGFYGTGGATISTITMSDLSGHESLAVGDSGSVGNTSPR